MAKATTKTKRNGKLNGDIGSLKPHEIRAVEFLLGCGVDVKVIPPSRNRRSADFWIERQRRELKTPIGASSHNIEHAFKKGAKQAEHIIFDARWSPKSDTVFTNDVVRALHGSSTVRSVWIIKKSGNLYKISKKEALKLTRKMFICK